MKERLADVIEIDRESQEIKPRSNIREAFDCIADKWPGLTYGDFVSYCVRRGIEPDANKFRAWQRTYISDDDLPNGAA